MMELHQLRYAVAVADTASFTAAAARERVAQSGVSSQVQRLERELGVALFDRSGRRVTLTPEGERMMPLLRAALSSVDAVREQAADLRGAVIGSLRVGTVTGLDWPVLFDALAEIHHAHPGVELNLREGISGTLIEQVREGELDVAVAAWAGDPPAGLETSIIVDDPLVAIVARDHPWASRRVVRPDEVAGAKLIALAPGTGARLALDRMLARIDAVNRPLWEVATPAFLTMLAARGLGVGVMSEPAAEDPTRVVLRIADPKARSQLGVVWRPDPRPATRALLKRLI